MPLLLLTLLSLLLPIVPSLLFTVATTSTGVGGGLWGVRDVVVVTAVKLRD